MDGKLDNIALLRHLGSEKLNLTSTEKLVAIILMTHRNNISMMCCPGLTLLSRETKFTRRTVQKAIKSLIKKKEIIKLQIKNDKVYLKSQYYFLYDIDMAKTIYEDENSLFRNHHENEVDNFEHCLAYNMF